VFGAALSKIFPAVIALVVKGYFAECQTQHSSIFFFKKKTLLSAANLDTRQRAFLFFLHLLCRVPLSQALGKVFFLFF
jgi:hypothetical protein